MIPAYASAGRVAGFVLAHSCDHNFTRVIYSVIAILSLLTSNNNANIQCRFPQLCLQSILLLLSDKIYSTYRFIYYSELRTLQYMYFSAISRYFFSMVHNTGIAGLSASKNTESLKNSVSLFSISLTIYYVQQYVATEDSNIQ